MPRPRHPMPPALYAMKFDPNHHRYFITENGITYFLTLEHTRLIKEYFRGDSTSTIETWFESLSRQTKKEIYIEGVESVIEFYYDGDPIE